MLLFSPQTVLKSQTPVATLIEPDREMHFGLTSYTSSRRKKVGRTGKARPQNLDALLSH